MGTSQMPQQSENSHSPIIPVIYSAQENLLMACPDFHTIPINQSVTY